MTKSSSEQNRVLPLSKLIRILAAIYNCVKNCKTCVSLYVVTYAIWNRAPQYTQIILMGTWIYSNNNNDNIIEQYGLLLI